MRVPHPFRGIAGILGVHHISFDRQNFSGLNGCKSLCDLPANTAVSQNANRAVSQFEPASRPHAALSAPARSSPIDNPAAGELYVPSRAESSQCIPRFAPLITPLIVVAVTSGDNSFQVFQVSDRHRRYQIEPISVWGPSSDQARLAKCTILPPRPICSSGISAASLT